MAILESVQIVREVVTKTLVSYKVDATITVGSSYRTNVTTYARDDEELEAAIAHLEQLLGQRAIQTMERALAEDKK